MRGRFCTQPFLVEGGACRPAAFLLLPRWVSRSPPHPTRLRRPTYGLWWLRLDLTEQSPGLFDPWTPAGERVSFPHTPFLWAVVEAAIFFDRPTWPAASKTNASWPAHRLGRAGEVVYCREEKVGNRKGFLSLLPKGTYPRPQPAQPVGGPLPAFQ